MKVAVVLFNLGGPDSLAAVKPFLRKLFNDPAIIGAPWPIRPFIAWLISSKREKTAQEIYKKMGGKSPILENTVIQRNDLKKLLEDKYCDNKSIDYNIFIGMRYTAPFIQDAAAAVIDYNPDKVILLPLYPQLSTTTTVSSFGQWNESYDGPESTTETLICCYPTNAGFINGYRDLILKSVGSTDHLRGRRILFSAHGLPKKIVEKGDPYQWQIEQSAAAIATSLNSNELDWVVCYQSRVGPLEWIGPSTLEEIKRAADDGVGVVVVPLAFVSEHSETLVELDIEYRHEAAAMGIDDYIRVPTLSNSPTYIEGLAELVKAAEQSGKPVICGAGGRICPAEFNGCVCRAIG